jgi:hypothetical protein
VLKSEKVKVGKLGKEMVPSAFALVSPDFGVDFSFPRAGAGGVAEEEDEEEKVFTCSVSFGTTVFWGSGFEKAGR